MVQINDFDLEERHLKSLSHILQEYYPQKTVWAYGSRVKGVAKNTSDIDLVIFDSEEKEYHMLQDLCDDSDIPFLIQIMRWEHLPQDFKDNILEAYYILQK